MAQTAGIVKKKHYLDIAKNGQAYVSEYIPKTPGGARHPGIDIALFEEVAHFYYNGRLRLSFSVSDTYRHQYVMIRGLIEFHRSKHFTFSYNRSQRLIDVDIDRDELEELKVFLAKVLEWLKQENQFKLSLKLILEFETRYRIEREIVYAIYAAR